MANQKTKKEEKGLLIIREGLEKKGIHY